MNECLVSIIVPTYKRSDKLSRAISSCLHQDYRNIEILVVDDNDPDTEYRKETEALMDQYTAENRVRYIKHDRNRNGSAARNTGIRAAKGDYITFLDDDDEIMPGKISSQVDFLLNHEGYGIVCCGVTVKDDLSGRELQKVMPGQDGCTQYDLLRLRFRMTTGSNPMFTRVAIDETGYFDESFIRHQDMEYMVRVLRKYKLGVINEYLINKYEFGHPNRPNVDKYIDVQNHFFETFKKDIERYPTNQQNEIYRNNWNQICIVAIEAKEYKKGYAYYNKAKHYGQYPLKMKISLIKKLIKNRINAKVCGVTP